MWECFPSGALSSDIKMEVACSQIIWLFKAHPTYVRKIHMGSALVTSQVWPNLENR
jgi:hypothetical protein